LLSSLLASFIFLLVLGGRNEPNCMLSGRMYV
jgi:hypothetical protein